jgi:hypothetical protein
VTPFTLHVGAVVHNDPRGPESLSSWLHELEASHDDAPSFAALEYRKDDAESLAAQRDTLPAAFRSVFPNISDSELQDIALGYAFEPDALVAVFPDVQILWLEEGGTEPQARPTAAADWGRGLAYQRTKIGNPTNYGGYASFLSIALRRKGDAEQHSGNYERDGRWRTMIESQPREAGTWGIAILGKAHTRLTAPNSLVSQLLSSNILKCHSTSL